MIELKILKNQDPVFLNDWKSLLDVVNDFEDTSYEGYGKQGLALAKHDGEKILFGSYSYANYSGDAFVLVYKDEKLYEINGGHCSCYGLEDQWKLEETNLESLRHRLLNGELGSSDYCENEFKSELIKFLKIEILETNNTID